MKYQGVSFIQGITCFILTPLFGITHLCTMFGPFKGFQGILRLLEIIFSALCVIIVIFRGTMVSPWGIWCVFVWIFCLIVSVVLTVVEAIKWHILLAAFLPNWADLTCGLTVLCAVMVISATIIFAAVFVCLTCIVSILCFIFSLVDAVVFLIDGVRQRMSHPDGYLTSLTGTLRRAEAFIACIIITAAVDHFRMGEWFYKPFGMTCSIIIFAVCLLVTVVIIIINLLKLLQSLIPLKLSMIEFVFNIVAVVLYLLAVILWAVFGYKRYMYNPYICGACSYADMHTVIAGGIINLILYVVDLVLSFKSLYR